MLHSPVKHHVITVQSGVDIDSCHKQPLKAAIMGTLVEIGQPWHFMMSWFTQYSTYVYTQSHM